MRTRARLLHAAVAEFSDHGFSGARTERIAQRAGTNIRMLYHYFGGKDDLYVTVLEVVLANLRHGELQLDPDTLSPLYGLLRVFDKDPQNPAWQKAHQNLARQMVAAYLAPATP